jgi:signal transduction histidine kinase
MRHNRFKNVSLSDVMACALYPLMAAAAPRGQVVSVGRIPSARLVCDPERVSQAIGKALSNASEFTANGGRVDVGVAADGPWLRVKVEDSGIGIDAAHLDHVFEPYAHFGTVSGRTRSGAGLGLTLAREICAKHGGSIQARSPGMGQGSVFEIALPVVVVDAETRAVDIQTAASRHA